MKKPLNLPQIYSIETYFIFIRWCTGYWKNSAWVLELVPLRIKDSCYLKFKVLILLSCTYKCEADENPCRIQLAINVQIPVEFGGLGGQAIYIGNVLFDVPNTLPIFVCYVSQSSCKQ